MALIACVAMLGQGTLTAADAAVIERTSLLRPTAGDTAEVPRDTAAVRLEITSTSDWTVVQLPGVEVIAVVPVSWSGVRARRNGDNWAIRRTEGAETAVLAMDIVLHAPAGGPLRVNVDKGWEGHTTVRARDGDVVLGTVHNDVQSIHDDHNRRSGVLADEAIWLSAVGDRADDRSLVLAIHYPWFNGEPDDRFTQHPAQFPSTQRWRDVLGTTRLARDAEVDGFVVSWAGEASDGPSFDLAVHAAERTGQLITAYLETPRATSGDDLEQWLREALTRADSPAWLHHDDVPVVFAYAVEALPAETWASVLARLRADGLDVALIGDSGSAAWKDLSVAEHRYSAVEATLSGGGAARARTVRARGLSAISDTSPRLTVATVAPGYDDHLVRDGSPRVTRDGGTTYVASWDAAIRADSDWVLVTSWNEWYEATGIAPSIEHGDRELSATRSAATAWHDRTP